MLTPKHRRHFSSRQAPPLFFQLPYLGRADCLTQRTPPLVASPVRVLNSPSDFITPPITAGHPKSLPRHRRLATSTFPFI